MSTTVTLGGSPFFVPLYLDTGWAQGTGNLSQYLIALSTSMVQSNGSIPMTGSLVLQDSELTPKSVTLAVPSPVTTSYTLTLPGTAGSNGQVLSTDGSGTASWINAAGGGTVNSGTTGQLAYYAGNGTAVSGETMSGDATIASGGALTIANNAITNVKVSTTAAIALSKLASTTAYYWYAANSSGVLAPLSVTASQAVISDSNGLPSASSTTSTELSYVHGVTSAIQTQLNAINSVPTGTLFDFAGTSAPTGYLLCDGSAISRATYATLFSVISTTWGSGDGSTTFNIPNFTRRISMGSGGSGTAVIGNVVGNTGGAETVTLTTAQVPSGTYSAASTSTVTDPGHRHGFKAYGVSGGTTSEIAITTNANTGGALNTYSAGATTGVQSVTTGVTVGTTTSVSDSNGGGSHSNVQPAAIVLKIIKI